MSTVVDFGFSRPDPAKIAAAGHIGVMRYLAPNPKKRLTVAEQKAYHDAGLHVGVVWETTTSRALGGASAGTQDVAQANAQAEELGRPLNIPIYYACDFDVPGTPGAIDKVTAYFQAIHLSPANHRPVGVYGPARTVDELVADGRAGWAWEAAGWHHGHTSTSAALVQGGSTIIDGGAVDIDTVRLANWGGWHPQPGPAPQPPGANLVDLTVRVPELHPGARGDDVAHLQTVLTRVAGQHLTVDGKYGPATTAAVRNVQVVGHLPISGVCDAAVWRVLILAAGIPAR